MTANKSWLHQVWKRSWNSSIGKKPTRYASFRWNIKDAMRTRIERLNAWLQNVPCQHYGHKASIPELFQRRDFPLLALASGKLRITASPSPFHHHLLDAAARVGKLEVRLGYTFKNRMTCIQALKTTGEVYRLYFDGTEHRLERNNRLALLGDRVLDLAVCKLWFETGHSNNEHTIMSQDTVTRVALAATGRALGLHESILLTPDGVVTKDNLAEAFEALLGAIYVDSGYNMDPVKAVMHRLKMDDHQFLKRKRETDEVKTSAVLPRVRNHESVSSVSTGQFTLQKTAIPSPVKQGPDENFVNKTNVEGNDSYRKIPSGVRPSAEAEEGIGKLRKIRDSSNHERARDASRALRKHAQLVDEGKAASAWQIFIQLRNLKGMKNPSKYTHQAQKVKEEGQQDGSEKSTHESFQQGHAKVDEMSAEPGTIRKSEGATPEIKTNSSKAASRMDNTSAMYALGSDESETKVDPTLKVTRERPETRDTSDKAEVVPRQKAQMALAEQQIVNNGITQEKYPELSIAKGDQSATMSAPQTIPKLGPSTTKAARQPDTPQMAVVNGKTKDTVAESEERFPHTGNGDTLEKPKISVLKWHRRLVRATTWHTQHVIILTNRMRTRKVASSDETVLLSTDAQYGKCLSLLPEDGLRFPRNIVSATQQTGAYHYVLKDAIFRELKFGSPPWITFVQDALDRQITNWTEVTGFDPNKEQRASRNEANEGPELVPVMTRKEDGMGTYNEQSEKELTPDGTQMSNESEQVTSTKEQHDQVTSAEVQREQVSPPVARATQSVDDDAIALYMATLRPAQRDDGHGAVPPTGAELAAISQDISELQAENDKAGETPSSDSTHLKTAPAPLATNASSESADRSVVWWPVNKLLRLRPKSPAETIRRYQPQLMISRSRRDRLERKLRWELQGKLPEKQHGTLHEKQYGKQYGKPGQTLRRLLRRTQGIRPSRSVALSSR